MRVTEEAVSTSFAQSDFHERYAQSAKSRVASSLLLDEMEVVLFLVYLCYGPDQEPRPRTNK